ncbi:hypothetical protein J6590_095818 [Homalodisca vitripennis]|nr:hypothetical protein J6590_095818 [Homalodisca vitripennis]
MKISFGWEATYPKSFCLICTIFAPGQTSTVSPFSAQGVPAYLNKESPITSTPADDRHPIEYESEPASPEVQQTPKYYFEQLTFSIVNSFPPDEVPPVVSELYNFPEDLLRPNLVFFVNFSDQLMFKRVTTRSPAHWKPR